MDTRQITHQLLVKKWQEIILKRNESGLTTKEFCKNQQINIKSFYCWQHIVRTELVARMSLPKAADSHDGSVVFAPVCTPSSSGNHAPNVMRLQYGPVSLYVTEATSSSVLRQTLLVLKELDGSW